MDKKNQLQNQQETNAKQLNQEVLCNSNIIDQKTKKTQQNDQLSGDQQLEQENKHISEIQKNDEMDKNVQNLQKIEIQIDVNQTNIDNNEQLNNDNNQYLLSKLGEPYLTQRAGVQLISKEQQLKNLKQNQNLQQDDIQSFCFNPFEKSKQQKQIINDQYSQVTNSSISHIQDDSDNDSIQDNSFVYPNQQQAIKIMSHEDNLIYQAFRLFEQFQYHMFFYNQQFDLMNEPIQRSRRRKSEDLDDIDNIQFYEKHFSQKSPPFIEQIPQPIYMMQQSNPYFDNYAFNFNFNSQVQGQQNNKIDEPIISLLNPNNFENQRNTQKNQQNINKNMIKNYNQNQQQQFQQQMSFFQGQLDNQQYLQNHNYKNNFHQLNPYYQQAFYGGGNQQNFKGLNQQQQSQQQYQMRPNQFQQQENMNFNYNRKLSQNSNNSYYSANLNYNNANNLNQNLPNNYQNSQHYYGNNYNKKINNQYKNNQPPMYRKHKNYYNQNIQYQNYNFHNQSQSSLNQQNFNNNPNNNSILIPNTSINYSKNETTQQNKQPNIPELGLNQYQKSKIDINFPEIQQSNNINQTLQQVQPIKLHNQSKQGQCIQNNNNTSNQFDNISSNNNKSTLQNTPQENSTKGFISKNQVNKLKQNFKNQRPNYQQNSNSENTSTYSYNTNSSRGKKHKRRKKRKNVELNSNNKDQYDDMIYKEEDSQDLDINDSQNNSQIKQKNKDCLQSSEIDLKNIVNDEKIKKQQQHTQQKYSNQVDFKDQDNDEQQQEQQNIKQTQQKQQQQPILQQQQQTQNANKKKQKKKNQKNKQKQFQSSTEKIVQNEY